VPVVANPWKRFINTQDADMTEPGVYWNSAFAWLAGYAVNDATLPDLNIAPAPMVTVSWPLRSAPFALYQTTNLVAPGTWTLVTNPPAISNRTCSVRLPANGAPARFYRLARPEIYRRRPGGGAGHRRAS